MSRVAPEELEKDRHCQVEKDRELPGRQKIEVGAGRKGAQ